MLFKSLVNSLLSFIYIYIMLKGIIVSKPFVLLKYTGFRMIYINSWCQEFINVFIVFYCNNLQCAKIQNFEDLLKYLLQYYTFFTSPRQAKTDEDIFPANFWNSSSFLTLHQFFTASQSLLLGRVEISAWPPHLQRGFPAVSPPRRTPREY